MGEVINTFQNGLHMDNNVIYQPEGTYRFLKNLQLVSNDGNNVTLKDTLGNREIILLDVPFASNLPTYQTEVMPIGFISFPDRLIVFHTNSESATGSGGEIGQIFLTNLGQSVEAETQTINSQVFTGYVPLYYHEQLKFSKMYKTEGFGFPENDDTNRVYWTDYYNEPRVFNVTNPIFTTYINTNSLIIGKTYMVIAGVVNHNGVDYGKGLATSNIFTAVSATYTPVVSNYLVIEYFPYELLAWTPSRSLGNMVFNSYGSGVKRCGSHMYFYRLGKRSEGYFTSWSYGNYPIHVGVQNDAAALVSPPNPYTDFVGDGSATTIVVSDKSIKIDVSNIDLNFDIIQLACAEYDQLYTTPYAISIVVEQNITATEMTLEDFGNVNKGNLTLDDITLFPASILKCKTITTNKNYNIIANITERQEFDFSKDTVTISSIEYPMPVHGDDGGTSASCTNQFGYNNVAPTFPAANSANPAASSIIPWSRWLVTLGNNTTDTVSYNGIFYVTGDIITGVASAAGVNAQNTITFTGSGAVRPASYLRNYTSTLGADKINANLLRTISWDYKDPLIASTHRGYWSHETYRFGVLFYDKKGNPFYVRWIGDYQMPMIADKLGLMRKDNYLGQNMWSLNPSLIEVEGLELSQEIIDNISGFSIVRAPRDVRIVAQGLALQNNTTSGGGTTAIYPSDCVLNNVATIYNQVYTWLSPDNLLIDFPEKQTIVGAPDKMEEACWVSGIQWGVDGLGNPVTYRSSGVIPSDYYNVYAKFFNQNQDPSSVGVLRSAVINDFINIDEADTVVNVFGISSTDYLNVVCPTYINNYTNTDCANPAAGAQSMWVAPNGRKFVGGKKSIIYMGDMKHYNNYPSGATNYTATSTIQQKMIMNYVKELGNPYGGNGEGALASTLYISTGHFQPIDSTVSTDTQTLKLVLSNVVGTFNVGDTVLGLTSGATGAITKIIGANYYLSGFGTFTDGEVIQDTTTFLATGTLDSNTIVYLFNGIQVGGGDCFTSLVDYGYGLNDSTYPDPLSIGFYFPCECNSNYGLRRGKKISNKGMGSAGISYNPAMFEDYAYNAGYSSEGAQFTYPALPVDFFGTSRFPARARFAGQKIIGEIIDSFRTFLVNDYIDVNVQSGEINNVRAKGDYVYYWQNHAVGSMPILERQMISATQGAATTLGTGGVLSRFDIISPKYGNQHQHGLTETIDGWIWFDMRNKDVCVMSLGGSVTEITVPLGTKSFFNEVFLERLTEIYNDTYLNSQTYDISSDRPLMGTGIVGVYDPKNKMSYLTFKFRSYFKRDEVAEVDDYQIISKDFTIGFSHVVNKFVGFFDKMPAIWHNHNQSVLSSNNPKNLEVYYAGDMVSPSPFEIGNVVKCENKEYICYVDGSASYTVPPNPAMFVEINKTNQIWIENEELSPSVITYGYQYDKFYGRVVNNELEYVITPKAGQISVTNYEMGAEGDNITDVVITADNNQTASDSNIKSYNRDYKYYDGSWWGNLPLSRTMGRITDKYLKIRVTKKNYDSNPTVYNNKLTIFQYFKSFFENKR